MYVHLSWPPCQGNPTSPSFRPLKYGKSLKERRVMFVIRERRIGGCAVVLSTHFRDVRVYPFSEPESVRCKTKMKKGHF
jgi:hypothetical protein